MKLPAVPATFRDVKDATAFVGKAMAAIAAGWLVEHTAEGAHGNVSCQTLTLGAALQETAAIYPPALTAATHDFSHPGLATARRIFLSATGAVDFTGIAVPDHAKGWVWTLINTTASIITVKHATGSLTGNRFRTPNGADFPLDQYDTVDVLYDPSVNALYVKGY